MSKTNTNAKLEQITKEVLEGRESFCGAEARRDDVIREEFAEALREMVRAVVSSAIEQVVKSVRPEPFWAKKWRGRP
ncbi:hypothetical protein [Pseudomonas hormoni]